MLKGKKNNSCLYFKGEQGIGKSTLFQFLREHVLGKLFLETDSEPIRSRFNSILGGKLLVAFEELPTFSTAEWMGVSSKLKRYITSNTITLEAKNKDSVESDNINNYVILSNNDAIQDDDGRRYFICDISNSKKGKSEYWDAIYKCFDDSVGHAFYCYLLEIDTENFNPQRDMPMTRNKMDAFAKRLDLVERFIKEEYILKRKKIKATVQELFIEFSDFALTKFSKEYGKIKFTKRLEELGIKYKNRHDKNMYLESVEDLDKIAEARHWIHELDEYFGPKPKPIQHDEIPEENTAMKQLKDENADLKRQLEEMKKLLEQQQKKPEPEPEPEQKAEPEPEKESKVKVKKTKVKKTKPEPEPEPEHEEDFYASMKKSIDEEIDNVPKGIRDIEDFVIDLHDDFN
jgi:hypothetical protein